MQQLIEKLVESPHIILVLISWPVFLYVAKVLAQKALFKSECKVK